MSKILPPDLLNKNFRNRSLDYYFDKDQYCRYKSLVKNINPTYSGVAPPYTSYWSGHSWSDTYDNDGIANALGYQGNRPYGKYFHLGPSRCGRYGKAWLGNCDLTHDYEYDFGRSPYDFKGQEPYYTTPEQYRNWDENMGFYKGGKGFVSPTVWYQHPYPAVNKISQMKKLAERAEKMAVKSNCSPCAAAKMMMIKQNSHPFSEDDAVDAKLGAYKPKGHISFGYDDYELVDESYEYGPSGFYKFAPNLGNCACYGQCPYYESAFQL